MKRRDKHTQQSGFYFQQDACPPGGGFGWLTGSIRRKLTLFVLIILVAVVGMFWFLSVYMLKPAYEVSIRGDLATMLTAVTGLLDDAAGRGVPMLDSRTANGVTETSLSAECVELVQQAEQSGWLSLTNRCLDISDSQGRNLLLGDGLRPNCTLHPGVETGFASLGENVYEKNSIKALRIRSDILQNGAYSEVVDGQIVMGSLAANGQLIVVVSANMERIPQAVNVLKRLLFPVSIASIVFSAVAAWAFSHWFTRPLRRLSAAAKEMARGNYDVRVDDCDADEIGELSRDFNQMAEEVKRSADLQRDILANVSHDLRTPLTLIKGYAETVRDLTGDDAEKRTNQLNVIVDESDRLSALVGSVLELSRVTTGNEKLEEVRFDLSQLGDELAFRYQSVSSHQGGYNFLFSGEEDSFINADPAMVERAMHNLIGNAVKHVGADGYIGLKIYRTPRGTVRCEVADHGPGIAQEDLNHIFDRYYRARSDAGKQGTGLGLSITKAIFEAHHFLYGVDTELGKGSVFWFEAPYAPAPPPPQNSVKPGL